MGASLFGLEAELALSTTGKHAVALELAVGSLFRLAQDRLVHLPGYGSRLYLANGSLFYVDCGAHPEVATPECTTPWEAVSHLRAAESMVARLAMDLRRELGADEVLVCRGNVDYLTGATWGCHESYLARLPVAWYEPWLVPHLVSRTVFTGSGGLDPSSPGIRFSISPRAAYIEQVVSAGSTTRRGIFHTRDEALAKGYKRLHVLVGDNACSQLATLLKVGTTALVVALAEACTNPPLRLEQPVAALRGFARDPTCAVKVETQHRKCWMSAFDIQRHYLAAVEAYANSPRMPQWAPRICAAWRDALDVLARDDGAGRTAFDWTFKRELFSRELGRCGFDWSSIAAWSDALEALKARLHVAHRPIAIDRARIDRLVAEHPESVGLVDEVRRALGARGLDWAELDSFDSLRRLLCAIDTRFGGVGSGIFDTLDRRGAIPDHRVVSEGDIAAAADTAPPGTRAAVRASWIKRLHAERGQYVCGWEAIRGEQDLLDLSDPFATEGAWRKEKVGPPAEEVGDLLGPDSFSF
jgi:proteasome accessory factor A